MAVAVVTQQTEKCELKSAPPDGYVVIRRMNYGESLQRKDMMASIAMSMDSKKGSSETKMQMDLLQEKTSLWEFSKLIVDHNLTDDKERKLDFSNPAHVRAIVGRIGDEIQMHIDRINSFEDTEETKN
jgi:hypothetical protein